MATNNKKINPYQDQINAAAAKYNVDSGFLTRLLEVESGFNPNAQSKTGPRGIAQFTKATGAKYGLVKDSDFYDPDKSINAAAAHISDLLKTNNQDYVRTALAYNQGEGTAGRPQLQAYDTGDFAMISNEGQNYIKKFRDWDNGSNAQRTQYLINDNNIQYKSQQSFPSANGSTTTFEGTTKAEIKSNPDNFPTPVTMDINGGAPVQVPTVGNNYEADMFTQTGRNVEDNEDPTLRQRASDFGSTVSDYAQKTVGYGVYRSIQYGPQNVTADRFRSIETNQYAPDDDDFKYARDNGVMASNYGMIEGASSKENWKFLVDEVKRTQGLQASIDASDSTSGKIVGFATDIALDPTSYIPFMGGSMRGVKIGNAMLTRAGQGVVAANSSAFMHQQFSGEQADYATATVFGSFLGSGFGAVESRGARNLFKRGGNTANEAVPTSIPHASQEAADNFSSNAQTISQRIEARESADTLNGVHLERVMPDPNTKPDFVSDGNLFWNHPHDPNAVVMADGSVIEGGNMLNPKTMMNVRELMHGNIPAGQVSSDVANAFERAANEAVPDNIGSSKVATNSSDSIMPEQSTTKTSDSGDIVSNAVEGKDASGKSINATQETTTQPKATDEASVTPPTNSSDELVKDASSKAAKSFHLNLGSFTEIGNRMIGSDDDAVRGLGAMFFRPTMDRNGSRGLAETTSSDIIQRMKCVDNLWYSKFSDLKSKALNDIKYSTLTRSERELQLNRNVVEAVEDISGSKLNTLTKDERNLAEHIRNNFIAKEDYAVNPAQLGNYNAVPVMDRSFKSGNYVPRYYNQHSIMELKDKLLNMGIKQEDVATVAKDMVKKSFKQAYLKNADEAAELNSRIIRKLYGKKGIMLERPDINDFPTRDEYNVAKKAFDEQQAALHNAVEEHIEKLSYGIVNGGEDNIGGIVANLYGHGDGAVTKNAADFLKERSPLSTDEVVRLPDGSAFSVNDIRDFDLHTIIPSYNSNMNHKLATHGVGFTDDELRDFVNTNMQRLMKEGKKRDAEALENGYKIITGQNRRDTMEGVLDNFMAAAQTATFGSRNTYFGAMTATEINNMIAQGSWRAMLDNIPILRDAFAYNTKAGRETLEELHNLTFGSYLDDSIRPRYKDRVAAINANPNAAESQILVKSAAGVRTAADVYSHYNPFTYILRETTNGVINTARKTLVSDIVRNVFDGAGMPRYLRNEAKLNGLSVTEKQMDEVRDLIKDHIEFKGKGNYTLKDQKAWVSDPRTAILFRLAENYADKVILRPETISSAQTKLFPRSLNMLTQFKMFSVRSINGRMMSMLGDTRFNHQYLDNAMELTLGFLTAGLGYMGQTYGQSYALPPEKRDEYLAKALDNNNFIWNVMSRSSVIGGPIGLASTAYTIVTGEGPGQYLRSTVTPSINDKDDSSIFKGQTSQNPSFTGAFGRLVQQMPPLSYTVNLLSAPYYTSRMLMSDEYSYDKSDYATAAFNNWRGILPNNPLTYAFLDQVFRTQGLDTDYLRNH